MFKVFKILVCVHSSLIDFEQVWLFHLWLTGWPMWTWTGVVGWKGEFWSRAGSSTKHSEYVLAPGIWHCLSSIKIPFRSSCPVLITMEPQKASKTVTQLGKVHIIWMDVLSGFPPSFPWVGVGVGAVDTPWNSFWSPKQEKKTLLWCYLKALH